MPVTVALTTLGTNADVGLNAVGNAAIATVNQPGVLVNAAGAINAQVNSVATSGDGAPGVVLRAVDGVIFTGDNVVSTVGNNAPGLDIQGSTVNVSSNLVQTQGANSNGVQLVSLSGPINLNADAIDTAGDTSSATVLRSAGPTNVNVGVLRTQGGQALGLDIATNPATCILLGNGGCNVTAAADQITTGGFGGIGALVSGATGVTTVNVGALQTGGDEAAGLNLSANPVVCATLGDGACDQNFTVGTLATQGARSPGALVRAAGNITGNVDVLSTNGANAVGLDLASDPTACATLGAGHCGTSFSVGQLTTSGVGATGVLARVAGPTTGRVGVLGTSGDNANGIDIAGDPTACVLLGNGACDVDLAANQVTTRGNGAAGVLINTPATVLANIGSIATGGNDAPALSIVTDPAACIVLGPGACGITATTGPVTTGGDGSPGVGVVGGGDPVVVTTGPVTTGGNNSGGVDVTNDGPTTVTTGPVTTGGDNSPGVSVDGGMGPTTVTTGPVTTTGDNSDGVDVSGTGPITVSTGDVTTGGDGSTGIGVTGGDGPITVTYGNVTTSGDNAPGVDVSGNGPISVSGGGVTTSGTNSDGVAVAGGIGPVQITTGPIATSGSGSDGIAVTTTSGNQTITAGPITTRGAGATGITAVGSGCSTIAITATGPISSAQASGISASSACGVAVTTLAGAPVSGQTAGIAVTSGTGSTITIGDRVSSGGGAAIQANGAPAQVTITPTGTLVGYIGLTPGNDSLVNNGTFQATADSDFGGGTDSFVNMGTLSILPTATAPGAVTFRNLESTANSGLIDLRNGHTGDTLTLPGSFTGAGASRLAVDVSVGTAGATADKLVIGGAATGSTAIILNSLVPNPGILVNGLVVVDAGAGTSPTAFTLANGGAGAGLVGYALAFDPAGSDFALYGTPSIQAYELLKASEGARQIFYRGDDAWSGHMQSLRDDDAADDTQKRGSALWGQAYAAIDKARSGEDVTLFGQTQTVDLDYRQDFFGGQLGYDLGGIGRHPGSVVGVTAGYASSDLIFGGNRDRLTYDAANIGAYAGFTTGHAFLNLLGRYEHYWARALMPGAVQQKFDGNSWGGKAEAGLRFGQPSFYAEPVVAVEFVRTKMDALDVGPTTIDLHSADGIRGSAGLRLSSQFISGPTRATLYFSGSAVREFAGRSGLGFENSGQTLNFQNDRIGTYGRGTVGVNITNSTHVSGFIEANGDYSHDYKGGGGRAGLNIRF